MAVVRWSPSAKKDLLRLHSFIAKYSEDAANRAVVMLVDAADSLVDFPEKGRLWEHDDRSRELLIRFGARGYVLRYIYSDDVVFIARIWHAREDR